MIRSHSGRSPCEMTLDRVAAGEFADADVRISAETLRHQAAAAGANRQLSENLLRAAELTLLPDEQVLSIYEALRPRRSTAEQLSQLSDELAAAGLPGCATLVREAMTAYRQRGLLG